VLTIRSEEVNRLATELASRNGTTKTEAVRKALENEIKRAGQTSRPADWLKRLQDEIASYPDTGLEADKAFFDELSGEY
jgi:antitoxin VapB